VKDSGSSTIAALMLGGLLMACGGGGSDSTGGGTPPSHDGTWLVTVAVDSCYTVTGSGTVTVTGGTFAGTLFTYCANAQSGDTHLTTTGCGSDITQTVSLADGAFTGNVVDGNLFLAGGACNGGNGFYGTMSSSTAGTASSYWGTVTFTKQ
jgi:hypothetical protein